MEKGRARRKALAFFWMRAVCFLLLIAIALGYTLYVVTPKHDYGICSMQNLYRQPEDTVDVLVLGTSLAYAGVNTNILWAEYGIAAYDLCSAEQPFWVSYYYLLEALKIQSPSLILLDAKPAIYDRDYSSEGRTILSTYGIRDPLNRWKAICACVGEDAAMDFALGLPKLHHRYRELTAQDLVYPTSNGGRGQDWKGYIEQTDTEKHERPSLVWVQTKRFIHERQEEYFRKILELAGERGIPVAVISLPNPDYANDHMFFNTLQFIAAEYDVPLLNYNEPQLRYGLRYSSDFADWQHLNVKGSVTFSRKLGLDLRDSYCVPDRRGDTAFASYDTCAQKWFAQYPEYVPEEGTT